MFFAILVNICATVGTPQVQCDTRVIYNYKTESQMVCRMDAEATMDTLLEGMRKDKKFVVVSTKADCLNHDDIRSVLNALPDYMDKNKYMYSLKFY